MNTVPHSETPITTRQSAITDPTADRAVVGASARASMGRRELLRHVGTFGLGAVSFGVLGLGLTGCTPSNTPSSSPSGSASGSASASPSSTPSASSAAAPSASGSATGT
ncbi:MAG: polysaccharide deacetylase family protein, partial [Rothia mucilaginosa]